MESKDALVRVRGLTKHFVTEGGLLRQTKTVHAVNGVDMDVFPGETLGLVGESGCGKSTVGRTILQLYPATAGSVRYGDDELTGLTRKEMLPYRRRMQIVFQDPYSSLNPRLTVGSIVAEPLLIHHPHLTKREREDRSRELLRRVNLDPSFVNRFPHEFSGGQRQRIGIARALAVGPEFVVCDEPISALDVSVQAQVVTLLERLQQELNLTFLFIAHDLSMVRHISSRIAVMYLGRIVELASRDELFEHPQHPYTRALLAAIPVPDPAYAARHPLRALEGEVPNPLDPPRGCPFAPRCPLAQQVCRDNRPELEEKAPGHFSACHMV